MIFPPGACQVTARLSTKKLETDIQTWGILADSGQFRGIKRLALPCFLIYHEWEKRSVCAAPGIVVFSQISHKYTVLLEFPVAGKRFG
jgi:hypothetical protein